MHLPPLLEAVPENALDATPSMCSDCKKLVISSCNKVLISSCNKVLISSGKTGPSPAEPPTKACGTRCREQNERKESCRERSRGSHTNRVVYNFSTRFRLRSLTLWYQLLSGFPDFGTEKHTWFPDSDGNHPVAPSGQPSVSVCSVFVTGNSLPVQ